MKNYLNLVAFVVLFLGANISYAQPGTTPEKKFNSFSSGGIGINGAFTDDVSNRPSVDVESLDFIVGQFNDDLHLSLKHSVNSISFNFSDNDLQKTLVEAIGTELVAQSGGTFYAALGQKFNGALSNNIGWYLDYEVNGGIIPFGVSAIDETKIGSESIWKTNAFIDSGFEIATSIKPVAGGEAKELFLVGTALIGFSHVFADEEHIFFDMYQDERGNKANNSGITYNFELSLTVADIGITIGTLGRWSFGSGISDAEVFGLQPRGYISFESTL